MRLSKATRKNQKRQFCKPRLPTPFYSEGSGSSYHVLVGVQTDGAHGWGCTAAL
jgi:hypothetical protein